METPNKPEEESYGSTANDSTEVDIAGSTDGPVETEADIEARKKRQEEREKVGRLTEKARQKLAEFGIGYKRLR